MTPYPPVLSEAQTIQVALDGMSLARFGDGELKICAGRDAKSQQHHPELSRTLCRILFDPGPMCLPCIPRITRESPKWPFWREYTRRDWTRFYDQEATYGSSFVTRPDSAPEINTPAYWCKVEGLWRGRDVVLVRGSGKSLTPERMASADSVHEILGPVQHAWAEHRDLFTRLRGERRRVILCLGATATALAWMLSREGVHALDLGHLGLFTKRIGPDGIVLPKDTLRKD